MSTVNAILLLSLLERLLRTRGLNALQLLLKVTLRLRTEQCLTATTTTACTGSGSAHTGNLTGRIAHRLALLGLHDILHVRRHVRLKRRKPKLLGLHLLGWPHLVLLKGLSADSLGWPHLQSLKIRRCLHLLRPTHLNVTKPRRVN